MKGPRAARGAMTDDLRLVRRAPQGPLVRLGERESASLVSPRLGARFPAYPAKELDFVLDVPALLRARREG